MIYAGDRARPVYALIDTGANVCAVSCELVNMLDMTSSHYVDNVTVSWLGKLFM